MKFVDGKKKKLRWYNRNFFWIVTIFYIAINIGIYAIFKGRNVIEVAFSKSSNFNSIVIEEFLISLGNVYSHVDWEHVLLNMLSISFCLFYLERKIGSVNLIMLLLGLSFLAALPTVYHHSIGNSNVWFACFGYVLIDFIFSFRKSNRNITNIIIGVIVLVLEFVRCGFYDIIGGGIGWGIVPYQLIYHHSHFLGFIIGVVVAFTIHITKIQDCKK